MNKLLNNSRIVWYIVLVGFMLVFLAFYPINKMVSSLRYEEQRKVELWANAISRKAELIKRTQNFYDKLSESEQTRLQQFIEAYKILMLQNKDANLSSEDLAFYTKIVLDNKTIPVIITDEFNNIQFSQNVDIPKNQKVLYGKLLKRFSQSKPYEYEVYGMKFKLYYAENEVYSNLRFLFDEVNNQFLDEVSNNTVFAPVIITDSSRKMIIGCSNIPREKLASNMVASTIKEMEQSNEPIKFALPYGEYGYIFYQKSPVLTVLQYYPILYAFAIILFAILFIMIFRAMKQSEQRNLWVGISKETAHQLGTPISSLVAWIELLKTQPENADACKEINKDVQRLDVIAKRFSQIGSNPEVKQADIISIIDNGIAYIAARSPKKIKFVVNVPHDSEIIIPVNKTLMEWTLENLTKNAIDAMEGCGTITFDFKEDKTKIILDISDTGKGMEKKQFKQIFKPGYTTKKRGWGMGLSLVKRIVEEYHSGKVYVKSSTLSKGSTFRIELPKYPTK